MNFLVTFLLSLFLISTAFSQSDVTYINDTFGIVKSKDGIILGKKNDLVKALSGSFNSTEFRQLVELGFSIDTSKITDCLLSKFALVDYATLKKSDTINMLLKDCFNDFFNSSQLDKIYKNILLQHCRDSLVKKKEVRNLLLLSEGESVDTFCDCFMTNIMPLVNSRGSNIDLNSFKYDVSNEIIFPCLQKEQNINKKLKINSLYNPKDIIGYEDSSVVTLLQIADRKLVQITIGSIAKYFHLDTGSDYLIIDNELENELLSKKILLPEKYVEMRNVNLANQSQEKVKVYKVDKVMLGEYTLRNVEIGVLENGHLLCGLSLLNKFKNWEVNAGTNSLKLFK